MDQQQNRFETLRAWADIVIERWEFKIAKLNVVDTGELLKSFTAQIMTDANGDAGKIVFTFLYYGIFPDMGVRRGVPASAGIPPRNPKPWKVKIFFGQVSELGKILAEKYGEQALLQMFQSSDFKIRYTA